MRSQLLFSALLGASTSLLVSSASAGTVGLWLFDELVDQTPPAGGPPPVDPLGGETLYDSSGNNLHFVAADEFGTISLTTDRPGVMPAGTYALDSNSGGARLLSTPASTGFHIGNTGQLTVEFWYKHITGSSFPTLMSFNGGNGAATAGDWGMYVYASLGNLHSYAFPAAGYVDASLGGSALDGQWHHVASTMTANDAMRVYIDGGLVNTVAMGPMPTAVADVLKLARDTFDGQGNVHFLMDELRISDVALLPGNGNGDGVLAWNTSLYVPEPSTLAVTALAGLALAGRRRR